MPTNQAPPIPPAPQAPAVPQAPGTPAGQVPPKPPAQPAAPVQAGTTHPYTVFQNYYAAREALLARAGGNKNTAAFKAQERPILEQAINQIFTSQVGTYAERKAALQRVYQYSAMAYAEYNNLDKQLARYAGMAR